MKEKGEKSIQYFDISIILGGGGKKYFAVWVIHFCNPYPPPNIPVCPPENLISENAPANIYK